MTQLVELKIIQGVMIRMFLIQGVIRKMLLFTSAIAQTLGSGSTEMSFPELFCMKATSQKVVPYLQQKYIKIDFILTLLNHLPPTSSTTSSGPMMFLTAR